MKSFYRLAFRYLRRQFRRSLFSAAGIFLAVLLITTVGVLGASIHQAQIDQARELSGDYHAVVNDLDQETAAQLARHPSVAVGGTANVLGAHHLSGSLFISLEGMDARVRQMFGMVLQSGRFPENAGEIALEEWVLEHLPFEPELGQKISLAVENSWTDERGQFHQDSSQIEFTLVGILKDFIGSKAVGASLGLLAPQSAAQLLPPEHLQWRAFLRFDERLPPAQAVDRLRQTFALDGAQFSLNERVLEALNASRRIDWPSLFLGALVVIATVATIYNAFHLSVVERTRQFGMLRAVGAASYQVRRLVLLEALILSLAAVPAGLALGVGFAWVLARGVALLETAVRALVIPGAVLLAAASIGLGTALLSALYPAFLAGRVSPMDALLDRSQGSRSRIRPRRWHILLERSLGITGKMAYQNLWRERLRTWITIFSLGLGVVIFIVFSYFAASSDPASIVADYIQGDFSLTAFSISDPSVGFSPAAAQALAQMDELQNVSAVRTRIVSTSLPQEQLSPAGQAETARYQNPAFLQSNPGQVQVHLSLFGFSGNELAGLQEHVIAGEIDPLALQQGPYALVVDPQGDYGVRVGDSITLTHRWLNAGEVQESERTFTVVGILDSSPVFMGFKAAGMEVLVGENSFTDLLGRDLVNRYDIRVKPSADLEQVEAQLAALADAAGGATLLSYQAELERLEGEKREMMVLFYGLVAVVALIGTINMVNTLAMGIILRTREFGALRAVGLTSRQLRQMTRAEGLLYGLISGVLGTWVGSGLAYGLYLILKREATYLDWQVPWIYLLAALAGCIFLGMAATLAPSRRIASQTILDAIRTVE